MLERVDRVQMAAEVAREEASDCLNARRTILALGANEVELCAPRGAGIVRAHLAIRPASRPELVAH
jgi:hypothetical protein